MYFLPQLSSHTTGAFPNCWKFWNASVEKPDPLSAPYHGGFEDSYSIRGTPYRNVVLHEPLLAMIGTLPALFELFLHGQGHTPGKQTKVVPISYLESKESRCRKMMMISSGIILHIIP